MKMKLHHLLFLISLLFLTSCSVFSPVKTPAQTTYLLNTIPCSVPKKHSRPITVLILQPETNSAYNTTQMAYSTKPYQIAYYSLNQWAETPAQMLESALVQTLQNTRHSHAVVTPPFIGHYNYLIRTQIIELLQDFTCHPNMAIFTVRVQLIRGSNNQVIKTKQFSVSTPIMRATPYDGVIAANRSMEKILRQIAIFTLQNT